MGAMPICCAVATYANTGNTNPETRREDAEPGRTAADVRQSLVQQSLTSSVIATPSSDRESR